MWQSFSEVTRQAILQGQQIAVENQSSVVGSPFLFLGILALSDEESSVASLLKLSGVPLEEARLYAQSAIEASPQTSEEPKLSSSSKRILELAAQEARRARSPIIQIEHLFIACIHHQRGPHVGQVLRPLGLDVRKLREHLRGLNQSETPYSKGSPLNTLTSGSQKALEAAHDAMRASFCGRISTAHLLLGLLADEENVAVETLLAAGIDSEALKKLTRAQIVTDGEIATPQKKFSPAVKRALERAKAEAKNCDNSFIGPQHLLYALLPHPVTLSENLAFGSPLIDPLEKVWHSVPTREIQRQYDRLWGDSSEAEPEQSVTEPPSNWIKVDGRWMGAGALWWLWLFVSWAGPMILSCSFGLALLIAVRSEIVSDYKTRDRWGSFCVGVLGGFLLYLAYMFFVIRS